MNLYNTVQMVDKRTCSNCDNWNAVTLGSTDGQIVGVCSKQNITKTGGETSIEWEKKVPK
jgi:hypothetical protein